MIGRDPYCGKAWHEAGFELELDKLRLRVVDDEVFSPPIAALELGLRWLNDRADENADFIRGYRAAFKAIRESSEFKPGS